MHIAIIGILKSCSFQQFDIRIITSGCIAKFDAIAIKNYELNLLKQPHSLRPV
jgi:hypothetical protein